MMRLTIGVIARGGTHLIATCLASVAETANEHPGIQIILADCASRDGTTATMMKFARGRSDTSVLRIEGTANASVARNAILDRAAPGAVFLVDGDVELNPGFVAEAIRELEAGSCGVVFGQLLEFSSDAGSGPKRRVIDRYKVVRRTYVRTLGGVVMLGPEVVRERWRYDETQRRSEDVEFGLRLAKRFRILAIPIPMGTHHGGSYYAPERSAEFVRKAYLRPTGRLVRRCLVDPLSLAALWPFVSGHLVGLSLIMLLTVGVAARSGVVVATALVAIAVDVFRFAVQRRLRAYLPNRIIGALQFLYGMFIPEYDAPDYVVRRLYPSNAFPDHASGQSDASVTAHRQLS
jgi:glycosyltransferase involved in cell wall biosynthesis